MEVRGFVLTPRPLNSETVSADMLYECVYARVFRGGIVRKFEKISLVEGMNQQNDMRSLASVSMSLSLSFVFETLLFTLTKNSLTTRTRDPFVLSRQ